MTFTRAALWAWLDAHNIAFRDSVQTLVDRTGTSPNPWRKDARDLHFRADPPLLTDLAAPPVVTLDRATQIHRAPRLISCYIRKYDDADANVDLALAQLVAVFGSPTSTHQTNAIEHNWHDPVDALGGIRLLGFPRSRAFNTGRNDRHTAISGSATEASIAITPNWDPQPTTVETSAFATLRPLLPPGDQARLTGPSLLTFRNGFDRAAPNGSTLTTGFWAAADDALFVAVSATGRYLTFVQDDIGQVVLDIAKPAKGRGGAGVHLELSQQGQSRSLGLCYDRHDAPYMGDLADCIAARFGHTVTRREYYDC